VEDVTVAEILGGSGREVVEGRLWKRL